MENRNAHVELMLPGIDKIWVRSSNGQWKEKGIEIEPVNLTLTEEEDLESISKKRRWWQFWKK